MDIMKQYEEIQLLTNNFSKHSTSFLWIIAFIGLHSLILFQLVLICDSIITAFIQHVGSSKSPRGARSGVYVDPNYVRHSPRKKRRSSLPSSPYKDAGPTPPKQGRPQVYHPERKCGDCTVWLQMECSEEIKEKLREKHSTKARHGHPNEDNYVNWQAWLLKGGQDIDLRFDSCLCSGCYTDCQQQRNEKPRYYNQLYSKKEVAHCLICHANGDTNECDCATQKLAASNWLCQIKVNIFEKLFQKKTGVHITISGSPHKSICFKHFRQYERYYENISCAVCNEKSDVFVHVGSLATQITKYFGRVDEVREDDWICGQCSHEFVKQNNFQKTSLDDDLSSTDIHTHLKAKSVYEGIKTVEERGYIMLSELVDMYEDTMEAPSGEVPSALKEFRHYATRRFKERSLETMCNSRTIGTMFYKRDVMNDLVAKEVYRLNEVAYTYKKSEERMLNTLVKPSDIFMLLKEHSKTLLAPGSMDYRELTKDMAKSTLFFTNILNLSSDTGKKLINFINGITGSQIENENRQYENADRTTGERGKHDDRFKSHTVHLRIQMIIALLLIVVNPMKNVVQVVLGMLAFTKGLNEKGFQIMNRMGLLCSMDSIRKYGHFWAKERKAADEVSDENNVKVSIDNLNFTMKMAKMVQDGFGGIKRQLNLITGQLSFTMSSYLCDDTQPVDSDGRNTPLTAENFILKNVMQDKDWQQLFTSLFDVTRRRVVQGLNNVNETILKGLQGCMPSFTPSAGEKIVFATVQEVEPKFIPLRHYLHQLKKDLKIGEPGHIQKVLLYGDQQIYDLLNKIKAHDKQEATPVFGWLVNMPGDWHLLKTLGETIKAVIWDGGLKELTAKCGHVVDVYQWQDIHLLLMALHETLWVKCLQESQCPTSAALEEHLNALQDESNKNEISRFWSVMLHYINVYQALYFAIRSGNWNLRNAAIKQAIPIFAAFGHKKYVKLCCDNIKEISTLPIDLLKQCLNGGWSVSLTGNKYHNLAVDEAHENQINKTIKEMTTRPSHFRTVELANFMAYIHPVLTEFMDNVSLFSSQVKDYDKPYVIQRFKVMYDHLKSKQLFTASSVPKELQNVMNEKSKELSSEARKDLLNFKSIGEERVQEYVSTAILDEPTDQSTKTSNRKSKTFSKPKQSNRSTKSQLSEQKKSLGKLFQIVKELKSGVVKTCKYPLALAKRSGEQFNSKKSDFYSSLNEQSTYRPMFISSVPNSPSSETQVIMDFLAFIHCGPSDSCDTYADFSVHLWNTVHSTGLSRADVVSLIIDKPKYLPKPRELTHLNRKATKQDILLTADDIQPFNKVPRGTNFSAAFSDKDYKAALISFIVDNFIACATTLLPGKKMIIDSEYKTVTLTKEDVVHEEPNQIGEADYAIWFHARKCDKDICIICCKDTDIWVYGLATFELGWLNPSVTFIIERARDLDYININEGVRVISNDVRLSMLQYPVTCVCVVYILGGCDYVSSFRYIPHTAMLQAFLDHSNFTKDLVCVSVDPGSSCPLVDSLHVENCLKLICAAYFQRKAVKSTFPEGLRNLQDFISAASTPPLDDHVRNFIVSYGHEDSPTSAVTSAKDLVEIVRRISYVKSAGATCEENTMPTHDQLICHILRATYTMKLAINSLPGVCNDLDDWQKYGWMLQDGGIGIQWASDVSTNPGVVTGTEKAKKGYCSCTSGCASRCRSCTRERKPCNAKCKCMKSGRGCSNPFNAAPQPSAIQEENSVEDANNDELEVSDAGEESEPQDLAEDRDREETEHEADHYDDDSEDEDSEDEQEDFMDIFVDNDEYSYEDCDI